MPPTPALSFFDSSESISAPQSIDAENANVHLSLERERSMATTPLLPPVMMDSAPLLQAQPQHQQPSPVSQPTSHSESPVPLLPSPPLSSKPSVADFKPLATASQIPSMGQDAWSDRLGHANFTITPQPYRPARQDMDALRQLCGDWDEARIAYGRHISRIGEHYGHTSKTYCLTEAKWHETQQQWKSIHDTLAEQIADRAETQNQALEHVPVAVPKLHAVGDKFPSRGDEDIVGPMMRAATVLPATGGEDRKRHPVLA